MLVVPGGDNQCIVKNNNSGAIISWMNQQQVVWRESTASPIINGIVTTHYAAFCTASSSLLIFSLNGSRLMPTIQLESPASFCK